MKKIIILTIIFAGMFSALFAQDNAAKPGSQSFIGITAGYSHAMGNFTKNNYNDNASGYANASGLNFGMEGAWYFSRHVGIGGVFSSAAFGTKGLQTMVDGYKEAFDVDSAAVTVKGVYRVYNFLIGPYFSFPVKRFTFDLRVLGGLVSASTPEYKMDLEDQANATFYQNRATAVAFGFQGGVGIRYTIIKNLCAKVNVDYYDTKPDFKISNNNRQNNAGRLLTSYHEPIACVNFNIGIAYQFGR